VRVHVVDPSAYTPPYDHALCHALGEAGARVELITSRFAYGPVAEPDGYRRSESFYRAAVGSPASRVRLASKLLQHVPDMLRYRRHAERADVVHFQWLPVQQVDGHLLPSRHAGDGRRRPLVMTAHDVLPREPRAGQLSAQKRLYDRFDAIVVHSEHGRRRLVSELGTSPERVHVIAHGAFDHLAEQTEREVLAEPLPETDLPVVLCFGLIRPYKGIDVLLRAWREVQGAELWIVGMPRMDISELRETAPANVRFMPRFVGDRELPAYFRRADLVVLPYLQADQSGVLFTALAFGKPLLLSDVGGFPELARTGAAKVVSAGDADALAAALAELVGDERQLARMADDAASAARGRYSWDAIAADHLRLYEQLLKAGPPQR
jgi:glycosyltransferase involved in cell wall biosynthesis